MKQKTTEEMRSIVKAYSSYSGTKKEFCQEQGIKLHILSYWLQKFKKSGKKPPTNKFIPLQVEQPIPITEKQIELYYPTGLRLILPADTQLKVLQALIKTTP